MAANMVDYTNRVLSIIAQRYELDIHDLKSLINAELHHDMMGVQNAETSKNCCAFVKTNNKICQCSRGKKFGIFCTTHFNQFNENKLKYGYKKEVTTTKEMQKIKVNGTEYLYDNETNRVYMLKSPQNLVGYLRQDEDTEELSIEEIEN
jgi:hypothetical protein